MKKCAVCGRRIKSGWKYCYEHRNTREEPKKKWAKETYGEAVESFAEREGQKQDKILFLYFAIPLAIIIGIVMSVASGSIFLGFAIALVIIIGTVHMILTKPNNRAMKQARIKAYSQDNEFTKHAKSYIKVKRIVEKEKEDYQRKLFDEK